MMKNMSVLALLVAFAASPLAAQENVETEQRGAIVIQAQQDGTDGPVRVFSMSTDGTGGMDNFVLSSPLPIAGGWSGSDPTQMMFNPQVRKELELGDEQVAKLKEISKKFSKQLREQIKFDPGAGKSKLDIDRIKDMSEMIKTINKEREAAIGAVLLPHQSKRLKQISTQMRMKNTGTANALTSKDMAKELNIDDEQQKRLKKRAAEIKKKMEVEIAKLKKEAEEELLKELNREQRSKLKEMTGDKFEYKRTNWRDRIKRIRNRSSEKSDR